MNPAPPRQHCCDFCSRARADLSDEALLFIGHAGGIGQAICSDCVAGFAAIVEAHRGNPQLAASMIEAHNAIAARRRGAPA